MSKRKAPQHIDDSLTSEESSAGSFDRKSLAETQLKERKSLAFSEKRKKISTGNFELTQYGDIDTSQHQRSFVQNRVGIIEKISLTNFKCHSHLEFNFHSYINFILGRNGSN